VPDLTTAQRIAFGQYINDQVFPKDEKQELKHECPFHTDEIDLKRLTQKNDRFERMTKTMERSRTFLETIASWKKKSDLGLGSDFEKNLDNRIGDPDNAYDLEKVLGMIYRGVNHNLEALFRDPNTQLIHAKEDTNWDAIASDPKSVQGGLINAVATQLGWTFTTIKKMSNQATENISKTLSFNLKALKSMLKMQFSLFNMTLNELGIRSFPIFTFYRFDEDKFELLNLKNNNSVLVPTENTVNEVLRKAKEPNAYALMQGGSSRESPKMYLRDSSMPKGCPAEHVSLDSVSENIGRDVKANLVTEFMDYIDLIVQKLVIPRLDKIVITRDDDNS
jgi:hypothetical protein